MTTHAVILYAENGTYHGLHVWCDGYPTYTGKRLLTNYTDYRTVKTLVSLKNLNVLGDTIDECAVTTSFDGTIANSENINDIISGFSYAYWFKDNRSSKKAGEWFVCRPYENAKFHKLTYSECDLEAEITIKPSDLLDAISQMKNAMANLERIANEIVENAKDTK